LLATSRTFERALALDKWTSELEGVVMSSEKLLSLAVFLGLAAGMAGCNTVDGVGRDVEGAGEAVQDASNDVEDEIEEEKDD
jgi:predicted small secreted protein